MFDGRFDYLTAYMIVSISHLHNHRLEINDRLQLFGIFVGIFACGVPVYFLNPKVSLASPGPADISLKIDTVARARESKAARVRLVDKSLCVR